MPNGMGGRGIAKYVKQEQQVQQPQFVDYEQDELYETQVENYQQQSFAGSESFK